MNKEVAAIHHAQWRKIVDDCINRKPGITKRQWCEDNGIRIRSLMYWQRKFQLEELEQIDSSHSALPASTAKNSVPAFVDVTAQLEKAQEGCHSITREPEYDSLVMELMIQTGAYRIYVNSSIHEDTLEKVMRAIRHA